ncbi:endonuclease I [Acholeplasma morum]|uniref:endonuclease I family protein n=1 Tax=Paracholeplasma morum TaxID=264637 RepID=UPI00195E3390|nr:endonuclease [Paracholeplasma morum]MBM7453972.1 endonuclease I [Paracholeplasma morum]
MVVGDDIIIPSCNAIDNKDPYPECGYRGTFDNTRVGSYTITFFAADEMGNQSTLVLTYIVTEEEIVQPLDPNIPSGYYANAEGKNGSQLFTSLKTIISGHTIYSYSSTSDKLSYIDADLNNPSKVYTIYTGTAVNGTWDSGNTWNKEHVWPQSSYDEASPMVSDMHQLRAAIPNVNSQRSNYYFNTTSSTSGSYHYESSKFYPGDDHRGDVARILLYMATRYYDERLRLTKDNSGSTTRNAREIGDIDQLLAWHIADPVDEFEVQRNNRIYGYQKNRNPYIDRPEFYESVYYYLLDIAGSIRSNSYKETIEIYQTIQVLYVPEYQKIEL